MSKIKTTGTSMNQSEQINSMLNSDDFEIVISGLTLLESLIDSEETLYEYIPCKDCSSFEDLKKLFEGEHCGYLALWTLGMLASFEVEWVLNITELDLGENELTSLPESITNLTQLESLYLYDNKLTSLPESIGNLTLLQNLSLSSNQLTELPETIGNLTQLKTLTISANQLTELPESIGNLTLLKTLDIRGNQFSDSEKENIRKMMSHVEDLTL